MATAENTPTLRQVIGTNARRLRGERSQDEIAAQCRTVGLPWSRQIVSAVEAGERQLEVDELVLLAWALMSETEDGDVEGGTVPDLLAGTGNVRIGDGRSAPLPVLRRLLSSPDDLDASGRLARPQRSRGDDLLAERRAATRLRIDAAEVALTAHILWGRSLTEQRDAEVAERVGADVDPRARQALRGRVTRELVEQIKVKIQAGG